MKAENMIAQMKKDRADLKEHVLYNLRNLRRELDHMEKELNADGSWYGADSIVTRAGLVTNKLSAYNYLNDAIEMVDGSNG